ncbi:hypothetical protein SUGI_1098840 [Cryptomeria japonica]|nr:hypothetical protein SUGI_1098840 [Cryptomeria japonica]
MGCSYLKNTHKLLWVIAIGIFDFTVYFALSQSLQCTHPPDVEEFVQLTDRFWAYDTHSNKWTQLELPFDLLSCNNGNCSKIGTIQDLNQDNENNSPPHDYNPNSREEQQFDEGSDDGVSLLAEEELGPPLVVRKRLSLTVMSETSVWITGYAISVFAVNHTFAALSEAGNLYQLTMDANAQPLWVECTPSFPSMANIDISDEDSSMSIRLRSGFPSVDGNSMYFSTVDGSLLELSELQPVRWINHGSPRGGDVAAIADAGTLRPEVIFTVSTIGELYEYDKNSKPSWKKHIWGKSMVENISLAPSRGSTLHGLVGSNSQSLFLLSKDGLLLERQLYQRKWKWLIHASPKGLSFSALGPILVNETSGTKTFSLFLTTTIGSAYEYQFPKLSGVAKRNVIPSKWIDHRQPFDAKVARSIPGVLLQVGRIFFPLDDGRLGELHLSGLGGEDVGPSPQSVFRRKLLAGYEWSVIDAPESEGGNAGYCTESQGPWNCVEGLKDAQGQDQTTDSGISSTMRRKKGRAYQSRSTVHKMHRHNLHSETNDMYEPTNNIDTLFRIRAMQPDRSFFLVTDDGITFEHLLNENLWIWLKHEHSSVVRGILGVYNGSLFVVDNHGNLFIRERNASGLIWFNCSTMEGGRQVILGSPWDVHGQDRKVTAEDALFFIDKNGNLIQFIVALRKFVWQDCGQPDNAQVASIADQELLRYNVVFVIGNDGHLYQYNRVTKLWYEHDQAPHLVLSRLPGVVVRPSFMSMSASLFMRSEDGGLVEFHWHTRDGWKWIVHGIPEKDVTLSTAPGPSFDGNQLFVIGTNGEVYNRYIDDSTWKWRKFGFPSVEIINPFPNESIKDMAYKEQKLQFDYKGQNKEFRQDTKYHSSPGSMSGHHIYFIDIDCDEKVAPLRPVPFSKHSVLFVLRDGRLAELRKTENGSWHWVRIINTPTSRCKSSYLTASPS